MGRGRIPVTHAPMYSGRARVGLRCDDEFMRAGDERKVGGHGDIGSKDEY